MLSLGALSAGLVGPLAVFGSGAILQNGAEITRDAYGVPRIQATTTGSGFRGFGRAVAQDRLWQMELSRRLARGKMAELGAQYRRSDEATLKQGYTDEELQEQFDALPSAVRDAFRAYVQGVNDEILARLESGTLPPGYRERGLTPEPWTELDSVAVAINLIRRFGTGGAGELRALALYEYLKSQKLEGRELDVMDDIAWHNDPLSPVTLGKEDEGSRPSMPFFDPPTRAKTLAHLAQLPKVSLLELAGAVSLASNEPQRLVAESLGVANRWGSYAVAVGARRSKTGRAFLLGAPQMGHSSPSVVHEAFLDFGPSLRVQGISIPGVPVIAIGVTPTHSWTLTTGAADVEDIFVGDSKGITQKIEFKRKDHEGREFTVVQERTIHGPVMLKASGGRAVFSRQSALWMKELTGVEALFRMAGAKTIVEVKEAPKDAHPCFNFFFAGVGGEIGWRFTGRMPVRARGLDPRFPTPSTPENSWLGYVPQSEMPQILNPKRGLLANWNNKPVSWWTNGDTPTWGRFFRSRLLDDALPSGLIGRSDLELAAWTIARRDTASPSEFRTFLLRGKGPARLITELKAADGWALDGSLPALVHREAVTALRQEIFTPVIGGLTGPSLFSQAIQPEMIWAALNSRSRYPYLADREGGVQGVIDRALGLADKAVWEGPLARRGFVPGFIGVPDQPPIPYINRGTYIHITEMTTPPTGRSVASPGAAEAGPHALDQTSLARAWLYKAMWPF
jgi:penicillin G amidase